MIVDEQEEQQDIAIVELYSPIYDLDKKTLKYDITPDNAKSIELPNEFGLFTLVIDNQTDDAAIKGDEGGVSVYDFGQ